MHTGSNIFNSNANVCSRYVTVEADNKAKDAAGGIGTNHYHIILGVSSYEFARTQESDLFPESLTSLKSIQKYLTLLIGFLLSLVSHLRIKTL